ncbi:19990_t:CDS:2 [Funneliformis geosporum]|nr:19990_t:CDS:2 [Funneliformis geosporum]
MGKMTCSNKEKTDSSNQQKTNLPLNELSDQELKKCLLEDFSRRLDLKKYFVFNLAELETMKTRPAKNRNAAAYEKQFEKKGYEVEGIPLRKNLIGFLGSNFDNVDDLPDEYSGDSDGKTILVRNNGFQVRIKHPTTTICDSKEKALEILKTDPALTGFVVIDNLTQKLGVELQQKKFNGLYFQTSEYLLLKPQTYMNNSGKFRYRSQGSDGGHNGMKNIINLLKSKNFKRLRVGIDYDRNLLIRD